MMAPLSSLLSRAVQLRLSRTQRPRSIFKVTMVSWDSCDGLKVEDWDVHTDSHAGQGWVPVRLISGEEGAVSSSPRGMPLVFLLHSTNSSMHAVAQRAAGLTRAGFLVVTPDLRYHGGRRDAQDAYQKALVSAWRGSGEHPFLLDGVWDLCRVLDWILTVRGDVDRTRVAVTGISLGGMHAVLWGAVDLRVTHVAPLIGVQGFGWALRHDCWQARVASIPDVFAAAAADLGKNDVDAAAVRAVWDRLLPHMLEGYDAPALVALISPRPLFVATAELDPRCPLKGVEAAFATARRCYSADGAAECCELFVERGAGHACSDAMWDKTVCWLRRVLA